MEFKTIKEFFIASITLFGNAFAAKVTELFVKKEAGKGLSANDFTDILKNKLNDIAEGAQVNVIESVSVNGVALEVTEKGVNVTVPTGALASLDKVGVDQLTEALASLINGKAEAATTLAGYGITDAYTKAETESAIAVGVAAADHIKRMIVESTDAIDVDAENADQYIYMVKNAKSKTGNLYNEYMVLDGALEKVGDWEIDLSGYVKFTDIGEVTNEEIDAIVAGSFTSSAK